MKKLLMTGAALVLVAGMGITVAAAGTIKPGSVGQNYGGYDSGCYGTGYNGWGNSGRGHHGSGHHGSGQIDNGNRKERRQPQGCSRFFGLGFGGKSVSKGW